MSDGDQVYPWTFNLCYSAYREGGKQREKGIHRPSLLLFISGFSGLLSLAAEGPCSFDGTKRLQSPDQKKVINRLPLNSLIPLFDIDLWSHTETSTANWALPEGGLGEGVEVRVPGFPWSPHH